jgi:hypothetical protein
MQSFKQFLQEEMKPSVVLFLELSINLALSENASKWEKMIKTLLTPKFKVQKVTLTGQNNSVVVLLDESNKHFTSAEVYKIAKEVKEELIYDASIGSKFPEAPLSEIKLIVKNTLPKNVTLEFNTILLNFHEATNVSLLGIHDQLKTDNVHIIDVSSVTSGGLGLMKFKKLTINTSGKQPSWVTIIENCHKEGKSIAVCQTELMKNGFKEYAKL